VSEYAWRITLYNIIIVYRNASEVHLSERVHEQRLDIIHYCEFSSVKYPVQIGNITSETRSGQMTRVPLKSFLPETLFTVTNKRCSTPRVCVRLLGKARK